MAKKKQNKSTLLPKLRFPEFREDGKWTESALAKLAEPVKTRAKKINDSDVLTLSGEHGIVRQTDYFGKQIAGKNLDRYLKIKKDDFVYNDRTTSAAKYGTIKRLKDYSVGAVSPIYKCFRFQTDENTDFWGCYFEADAHENALREHINEGARAGRFNISVDTFLSITVRYPKPTEQQKIADCLDSLDDLIAAHSAKLDDLQDHKRGLLQQLFPAEGESIPTLRFPEFEDSGEWLEISIQDLIDKNHITGHLDGNHGALYPRAEEFSEAGVPYITANDFKDGRINFGRCKFLPKKRALQFKKGVAKDGDILFAHNATVGPVAKLKTPLDFVILSTTATYFRCDQTHLKNDYLMYALSSSEFVKQYSRVMSQSTRNQVPITAQRKFNLQIPSPPEQRKIATCLSALDALIVAQTEQIDALREHKKGMMQQLFINPELSKS